MDSNQLLMLRMVIATTLFGLTIAATARSSLRLPRQGIQAAVVVGAINAAGMILFFLSLNYLEASLGAMIIALSPPIVLTLLASAASGSPAAISCGWGWRWRASTC